MASFLDTYKSPIGSRSDWGDEQLARGSSNYREGNMAQGAGNVIGGGVQRLSGAGMDLAEAALDPAAGALRGVWNFGKGLLGVDGSQPLQVPQVPRASTAPAPTAPAPTAPAPTAPAPTAPAPTTAVASALPRNYIQNERTGVVTDLGESQAPQQQWQIPQQTFQQSPQQGIPSWLGARYGPHGDILAADKRAIAEIMGQQSSAATSAASDAFRGAESEKERGALAPGRAAQADYYRQHGLQMAAVVKQREQATAQAAAQAAEEANFKRRYDAAMAAGDMVGANKAATMWAQRRATFNPGKLDVATLGQGIDPVTGESFAEGGIVRGYADGGAVGRDLARPAPPINPLIAQYGQYLTAAASAGVPPVPFTQYQNLLQTTRASVQGQPPVGFADGGDVSALGRPLEGPGTGTSDSIPAVIDGQQPAALSKDEFVFPAEVTKYYGTKFMNDLIAKAKTALSGGEGATAGAA